MAWKEPIERRVLGAGDMRGVVIVSGVAYGDGGGGIPGVLLGSPRDDAGNLIMLGTGQQHWTTVHVADLADVFRRVLEDDSARGRYVIGNGLHQTVAELTEAAAVAVGAPGAVPGSDEEARARLGDYFAEVLLLDQGTDAARARAELGWHPSHPALTDEFRHGSYPHLGPLHLPAGTLPPTGKRMDAPCCDVFELADGKIKRFDCYPEGSVILTQLGAIDNLSAALKH